MSFQTKTIAEYIDAAASNEPTPGGGSVSALVAALGSCMASMAGNFTVGKKKFAEVEDEVKTILEALAECRSELLQGMDDDAIAFAAIGAAYGMARESDTEKAARQSAIQESLKAAMAVPLAMMESAFDALQLLPRLATIGNPNLVSDTGVAAICLESAVRAAYLNVLINLQSLKDEALVTETRIKAEAILQSACDRMDETYAITIKTICS